jgi:hypothetical protein
VIKVQLVWQIGTDGNCMNVLHYQYGGSAPAASDLTAIGNHMVASWGTAQGAVFSTRDSLANVILTDLAGTTGQQAEVVAGKAGTDISGAISQQSATVMAFEVNARYRGGHPRAYFPPMTTRVMQDGLHWTAAGASAFNSAIETFLSSIVGFASGATNVLQQVAISYYQGHTWSPPDHLGNYHKIPTRRSPPLVLPVTSWVTRTVIGNQRRRKGG